MDKRQILWDVFLFGLGLTLGATNINFNHVDQTIQQIKYETVEVKKKFIKDGKHYILIQTASGLKEILVSPFQFAHIREHKTYNIKSAGNGFEILEERKC